MVLFTQERNFTLSVFSNRASERDQDPHAYVSAVLQLLGDRNPIDAMRQTPLRLVELISPLSPAQIERPEAPDKWSIGEVLCHLADAELIFGYRIRIMLAEDEARLAGYDQDRLAINLMYKDADPTASLDLFRALRKGNLMLIERVGAERPTVQQRVAIHSERGEISVATSLRLIAGHDLSHLRQIRRIVESLPS